MKRIRKLYVRGSSYPVYVGNGIYSGDRKKVFRFVNPRSGIIDKILN